MTEDQIERKVEILFNRIDAKLMRGEIGQEVYDQLAKDIGKWADDQYGQWQSLGNAAVAVVNSLGGHKS